MSHEWKFPAKLDENYDGDTFKLELDIGFSLRHYVSIRLHAVDTPELRGGSELTKAAAKLARDEAHRFVSQAQEVIFHSLAWAGKYGRPVGDLICDGVSLSDWLIAQDLGLPYDGGARDRAAHERNAQALADAGRLADYGIKR